MNFEKLTGLGIGSWGLGEDPKKKKDEIAAIRYGLDHGLSVIDTAEMYGDGQSEELIGEAIKGYDREKLFLISKFYPYHATPKLERQSLEASLKRLGTDHLDLYLLHWRGSHRLSDMQELFTVPGGEECFANEDLYNISERGTEFDLQAWQEEHGVNFIGYSPFNSGKGNTIRITRNLKIVARDHGVTPHQIMLAWTMRNGNVLTIPKASSVEHMKENIATQKIKLTDDELRLLNSDFPMPTEKTPLAVI